MQKKKTVHPMEALLKKQSPPQILKGQEMKASIVSLSKKEKFSIVPWPERF